MNSLNISLTPTQIENIKQKLNFADVVGAAVMMFFSPNTLACEIQSPVNGCHFRWVFDVVQPHTFKALVYLSDVMQWESVDQEISIDFFIGPHDWFLLKQHTGNGSTPNVAGRYPSTGDASLFDHAVTIPKESLVLLITSTGIACCNKFSTMRFSVTSEANECVLRFEAWNHWNSKAESETKIACHENGLSYAYVVEPTHMFALAHCLNSSGVSEVDVLLSRNHLVIRSGGFYCLLTYQN